MFTYQMLILMLAAPEKIIILKMNYNKIIKNQTQLGLRFLALSDHAFSSSWRSNHIEAQELLYNVLQVHKTEKEKKVKK